jgi:hypothetical protein
MMLQVKVRRQLLGLATVATSRFIAPNTERAQGIKATRGSQIMHNSIHSYPHC